MTFTPNIIASHEGGVVTLTIGTTKVLNTWPVANASAAGTLTPYVYTVAEDDLSATGYFQAVYAANVGGVINPYTDCVDYKSTDSGSFASFVAPSFLLAAVASFFAFF